MKYRITAQFEFESKLTLRELFDARFSLLEHSSLRKFFLKEFEIEEVEYKKVDLEEIVSS
jgi:hypothetical protein